MLTKAIGLDPTIKVAREEDWEKTKYELVLFLSKFIGKEKAFALSLALNMTDSYKNAIMRVLG